MILQIYCCPNTNHQQFRKCDKRQITGMFL